MQGTGAGGVGRGAIPNATLSPLIMIDRLISGVHCTQVPRSDFYPPVTED